MKIKLYSLAIASAALMLASCGGGQSDADNAKQLAEWKKDSTEKAEKQAKAAVPFEMSWEELAKADSKELDKASMDGTEKHIIIEGYLAIPGSIYTSGNSIRCDMYERPGQSKGFHINLEFQQGTSANHMEKMPAKYAVSDFKVHTAGNDVVGQGSYVKITGKLSRKSDDYATLYIDKVEKAEPKPFDYEAVATKLTDENIGDMNDKLVYVDGTLDVPMFVYITEDMGLNLENSGLKSTFSTFVMVGDGPNQISNLPSGWSQKDVKIHDYTGKVIGKSKTRVYGVFRKPVAAIGDSKGSIYVERIGK